MPDINLSLKVPAIEKLIDYGASGVGAIAGPMLAPWKASREGKARVISAETDAGVCEIEARSGANALNIIAGAQSEARAYLLPTDGDVRGTLEITREDITQSIEFQGRKRLANGRSVLEDAAEELGDKDVADHEPDPDWTARFFDCVQDVSSADMQRIWAKILAGEVESPGRTSLRTLETLRNMTKKEAETFRNICDFVIWNDFVFYHDPVKKMSALNYSNLLHLQDCGLINVGPNLVKRFTWGTTEEILLTYHSGALMVTKNADAKGELKIPDILLTTAGKELSRFVESTLNMEYLQAFSGFLKSENCQLFYLGGVVALPDGRVAYINRTPIEPKSEPVAGATP
jgi:hypothetical protein